MSDNLHKTDAEDWVPVSLPIPSHWVYVDFDRLFYQSLSVILNFHKPSI
jgi:hypothetical protein